MQVYVKLNSSLKRYSSNEEGIEKIQNPEAMSVKQLLYKLNIKHGEAAVILVNEVLVDESAKIEDGSIVELYPIFGGG